MGIAGEGGRRVSGGLLGVDDLTGAVQVVGGMAVMIGQ